MTQHSLFPDLPTQLATDHSQHGAQWRAGGWNCRNWHGYFQSREIGARHWCFQIIGFAGEPEEWGEASVYKLDERGEMVAEDVPIDPQNRLHILGRKYGRNHWAH